ncbi:hypothetical protein K1X76_09440 [bacterium]|nr:hypothetical protein [bacterium]
MKIFSLFLVLFVLSPVVLAKPAPVTTKKCIRKNSFGRCLEYNYIYSVRGIECRANCIEFDSWDKCQLRNECKYDEESGCFIKKKCNKIDSFHNCDDWEEHALCGQKNEKN